MRRGVVFFVGGVALGLVGGGCQDAEPGVFSRAQCEEGAVERCELEGATCLAARLCVGGRFSRCRCTQSRLGESCESSADCGELETCFDTDADYLGGHPVTNVCSLRCDEEPTLCDGFNPPAVCVVTAPGESSADDVAHCLARCDVGVADGSKCNEDANTVCAALEGASTAGALVRAMSAEAEAQGAGVCRPVCTSDAQCGAAECNLRTGACGEAESGLALGAACDSESEEAECAGICVEVEGVAQCSHRCRLGEPDNCAADSDNPGLCFFPEAEGGSVGDVGFCAELCDCDDDCSHPEMVCAPFGAASLETLTERQGVCSPRDGAREHLPCTQRGDAGAGEVRRADESAADAG